MSTEEMDLGEDRSEMDNTFEGIEEAPIEDDSSAISGKYEKLISEGNKKYKLTGMYKDWFLDYASYVILERAVPHISDGLKPVQRRILHAMKTIDDGRLNKVSTIVGSTMPFHPHGDASIKDALVQLGQKELLIVCQGNWGNILTGDSAAAGRYIEARLSDFALEVVFNSKTTQWAPSYDGRNQEPINLPVKFPLLLAQGSEGIAVGLASKILPHNFNELIDASVAILKGEEFEIFPDFLTGGLIDVSNYNQGVRGGRIRVRANIQKISKNTIAITEIPFGKTTTDLIDSILRANDRGKIKIKRIDDNTAESAEIVILLHNDISPDKTIDALYACTDCEVSISPNSCVIMDNKPHFIGVDEILKYNTESTLSLLRQELEIRLAELENDWHYTSLEKIFFEQRVYKILENDAKTWERQLQDIMAGLKEFEHLLRAPITNEDVLKLVEKPVRKISKFDIKAANQKIAGLEIKMKETRYSLDHIVQYAIDYFLGLKKKYGAKFPRKTEITSFETIQVSKVVANNAKLYVNREEGFIGTAQKKIENAEFVSDCSDIDEAIVFLKDGRYIVSKVDDKIFIDKNIIHVAIFKRSDERTIYNAVYRDGRGGTAYAKRFFVTGTARDKWYNITKGKDGSSILWLSVNPNGEAESLKIFLRPRPKLKKLIFEFDFASLAIKNRGSMGNIVTKNPIQRIMLKSAGVSTIGGKEMWFDWDVNRLNEDGRGELLGEFTGNENILAIFKNGTYFTTNLDLSNRYQGDLLKIEKFDPDKTYTAIYWDGALNFFYIKRFSFDLSDNTPLSFISEEKDSYLKELSSDELPQIKIDFIQNAKKIREPEVISAVEFISAKGLKAKGKRASSFDIESIEFIEPIKKEEPISGIATISISLDDDFDIPEEYELEEESKKEVSDKKNDKKDDKDFPPGSVIEFGDLTLF